jgi:hypothetical protein
MEQAATVLIAALAVGGYIVSLVALSASSLARNKEGYVIDMGEKLESMAQARRRHAEVRTAMSIGSFVIASLLLALAVWVAQ